MNEYRRKYKITANDIDNQYILTNSGIILYVQDAMAAYLAVWNAAAFDVSEDGLFWVILEYHIQISTLRPYWSDEIEVVIRATEMRTMRLFFDFEIVDSNGRVFSKGDVSWVLLEKEGRRLFTHSLDYIEKKSSISRDTLLSKHQHLKIPEFDTVLNTYDYKTQKPDIDFNSHINNRTYLHIAMGCFDEEFLDSHSVTELNIKYMHETFCGCTIHCICQVNGEYTVCKMTDDKNTAVCEIMMKWAEKADYIPVAKAVKRL